MRAVLDWEVARIYPTKNEIAWRTDVVPYMKLVEHPHTLTVHQLSSTTTSSNPPTPTPSSDYNTFLAQSSKSTQPSSTINRANRNFKRKFPNHPFTFKPRITRDYINYPDHTNTTEFLQISLPLFPQNTYNHSDPHTEQPHNVDEHALIPTLHWTSFYHFSNTLCLPLIKTPQENERNKNDRFRQTTSLTPRQFTHIGYKKY